MPAGIVLGAVSPAIPGRRSARPGGFSSSRPRALLGLGAGGVSLYGCSPFSRSSRFRSPSPAQERTSLVWQAGRHRGGRHRSPLICFRAGHAGGDRLAARLGPLSRSPSAISSSARSATSPTTSRRSRRRSPLARLRSLDSRHRPPTGSKARPRPSREVQARRGDRGQRHGVWRSSATSSTARAATSCRTSACRR